MEENNRLSSLGLDPSLNNFVFLGEAGSGKSEIAINFARALLERGGKPVHLFDLDMTKPLFRTRDQAGALTRMGIQFHCEQQFMDAPTQTGGVSRLLRDDACYTVLDVGGDYIGARSIGGYAALLNQPRTAVYYVINPFRPWSMTIDHIDRVLGETLGVSHVDLDHLRLAGNPNLGVHTTPEDVLEGIRTLTELVAPYKPIDFFCVWEPLYDQVRQSASSPLCPIRLYLTYPWNQAPDGAAL